MENQNVEINIPIKRKAGRPKKEDKKSKIEIYQYHNARLKDEGYFKNYYKSNIAYVECETCKKQIKKFSLSRHKQSKYCQTILNNLA